MQIDRISFKGSFIRKDHKFRKKMTAAREMNGMNKRIYMRTKMLPIETFKNRKIKIKSKN